MLESLERMLARGNDNPLLRFGLGKGYLDAGKVELAAEHLRHCVEQDPLYSAAWKLLGQALLRQGDEQGARRAWEQGSRVACTRGDKQAEREIAVFLRRLDKPRREPGDA